MSTLFQFRQIFGCSLYRVGLDCDYIVHGREILKMGKLIRRYGRFCLSQFRPVTLCGERPSSGRSSNDGGPSGRTMDSTLSRFRADHVYFSTLPLSLLTIQGSANLLGSVSECYTYMCDDLGVSRCVRTPSSRFPLSQDREKLGQQLEP